MFARGSSAALGERLQHLVALTLHFEVTRDVVEDQYVAVEEALAPPSRIRPPPAQHRCHLHANELAGLASGDEIGHRLRAAPPQAMLDGV